MVLALAMAAVAVVMALLGLRLTGLSPRLAAWQFSLPSSWGRWAGRPGEPASGGLVRLALLAAGAASSAARTLVPGLGTAAVAATERTSKVVDADGVQNLEVDIVTSGYSPAGSVVYVDEPGTYTFTCRMDMYSGTITAIERPGSSPNEAGTG